MKIFCTRWCLNRNSQHRLKGTNSNIPVRNSLISTDLERNIRNNSSPASKFVILGFKTRLNEEYLSLVGVSNRIQERLRDK